MNRLKKIWKSLGPGMITGGSDDDVSGVAAYSIAGARYGYSMLWMLLFILPFMIAIQEMAARIGALSGCGLTGNMKRHYPVWLLGIAAASILFANTFNIGANIYGMAGALNLVLPIPIGSLAAILSLVIIAMIVFLRYKYIVAIFKWLAMTLFAYMFAFLTVRADWGAIIHNTLIPSIHFNTQFLIVLFAVVGTTISPYLYFWQASEEAEDIRQGRPRIRICRFRSVPTKSLEAMELDTKLGMIFSNLIAFFIIALTATTLFSAGAHNISTLREAAQALEPLAGRYAYLLFTTGLLGAGMLSIPVLAGSAAYVLAELFGWEGSLDRTFTQAKEFYIVIIAAIALGLLIPLFGISPIQALFYTAILNGLISPILILLILHMSNNPAIVGPNKSSRLVYALGHVSFFMMAAGAIFIFIK